MAPFMLFVVLPAVPVDGEILPLPIPWLPVEVPELDAPLLCVAGLQSVARVP
jgi:hypothetical protein